jgi:hypothetical protein
MSGLYEKCVRFIRFAASGLSGLPIGNRTTWGNRTKPTPELSESKSVNQLLFIGT